MIGYDYSHSGVDGNGLEMISFMTAPPRLDENGLKSGTGILIMLDNKRQTSAIYRCRWERGAPGALKHLITHNDEILRDAEIPALMERLGVTMDGGAK